MVVWDNFSMWENQFLADVCNEYFGISIDNFSKDTGSESHIFYFDDTENTYSQYYIWYSYYTTILKHIDDTTGVEDIYVIDNKTGHNTQIKQHIS